MEDKHDPNRDNYWPTFQIQGTVEAVDELHGTEPALPGESVNDLRIVVRCGAHEPFPLFIRKRDAWFNTARETVTVGSYVSAEGIIPLVERHYITEFTVDDR